MSAKISVIVWHAFAIAALQVNSPFLMYTIMQLYLQSFYIIFFFLMHPRMSPSAIQIVMKLAYSIFDNLKSAKISLICWQCDMNHFRVLAQYVTLKNLMLSPCLWHRGLIWHILTYCLQLKLWQHQQKITILMSCLYNGLFQTTVGVFS